MIQTADIRNYLTTKQQLHDLLSVPEFQSRHGARHLSEGLSHSIDYLGQSWSFSREKNGFRFSRTDDSASWYVSPEQAADCFTANELCHYLQCLPQHHSINQVVVDTWLIFASQRGTVTSRGQGQFGLGSSGSG